jgi:hypothetical protein
MVFFLSNLHPKQILDAVVPKPNRGEQLKPKNVRNRNRNRRAIGSIPTRGPCTAFFAVVLGQFLKCIYTHLDYKP